LLISDRYEPTQADVVVFKSLPNAPTATHPHAARWYKHISSYASVFPSLPGDNTKSAADYVPTLKAQAESTEQAAEEEEDDDVDLFGSDDEEADAEAERVKQERLTAYAEKKSAKPKTIAKSIVTLDVNPSSLCSSRSCQFISSALRILVGRGSFLGETMG
jgi:elongation factor 1-beta